MKAAAVYCLVRASGRPDLVQLTGDKLGYDGQYESVIAPDAKQILPSMLILERSGGSRACNTLTRKYTMTVSTIIIYDRRPPVVQRPAHTVHISSTRYGLLSSAQATKPL